MTSLQEYETRITAALARLRAAQRQSTGDNSSTEQIEALKSQLVQMENKVATLQAKERELTAELEKSRAAQEKSDSEVTAILNELAEVLEGEEDADS